MRRVAFSAKPRLLASTREIDFVSVRDGIDTSTPAGRFTFHVIAAVTELERERLGA